MVVQITELPTVSGLVLYIMKERSKVLYSVFCFKKNILEFHTSGHLVQNLFEGK